MAVHAAQRNTTTPAESAGGVAVWPGPHSGIGLHTAASVHFGTAHAIRRLRQQTLQAAYDANPDRFRGRPPTAPMLPTVAWINPPTPEALIQSA